MLVKRVTLSKKGSNNHPAAVVSSSRRQRESQDQADEDVKRIYGLRRLNRETKHLEIMIEMQQITAQMRSELELARESKSPSTDQQLKMVAGGRPSSDKFPLTITEQMIQQKAYNTSSMRGLVRKAIKIQDGFRAQMNADGGERLVKAPNSYAFSKFNTGSNKQPNSGKKDAEFKDGDGGIMRRQSELVNLYKQCCFKKSQKIHPAIVFPLKYNNELSLDIDSLFQN